MKLTKSNKHDNIPARNCNQCGRDLIFVKKIVEGGEYASSVTTLIYRCSSSTCQSDINKKEAEREKKRKELKARTYKRPKSIAISMVK